MAFIINPASGIKGRLSMERYIERFFHQQSDWETAFCRTAGPNDAYHAALGYKEEMFDLVVAVGGDGTVNQVARALVHSSVPMGIIPTGSGNGLARHLKIPLSVPKAIALLLENHITSIDSGSLNNQPFFCTAGIGFDANLANRFNTATMRGLPSYLALSALEYALYQSEDYQIYVDEQILERNSFLITFANCAQWGYNVYIAPEASATDGLLDMVIWNNTPTVTIPFVAMRLLARNIDHSEYIENIRGTSFKIARSQEGWAHVDGEHVQMGKELVVRVHPASLKVVTPG